MIKTDLEKLLASSEEILAGTECGIQEFEHNKNTLDYLTTKFDDAEARLKSS